MMTAAPVLRLQRLRKTYREVVALDDVALGVYPGEVVWLLGPNGAGKSTLFQIASGLYVPDAGSVELFGMGYRRSPGRILAWMGVVFQSRAVDLDMTVRANLKFHGGLFGLGGAAVRSRIAQVTKLLEIAELSDRPVRTLSGGNQRRVEIARALLNRPELPPMGEPTVGLDALSRRALVDHLGLIAREHRTAILWATHLVEEVADADLIVLLVGGRIVHTGSPAALMTETGTASLTNTYIALSGLTLQPTVAQ